MTLVLGTNLAHGQTVCTTRKYIFLAINLHVYLKVDATFDIEYTQSNCLIQLSGHNLPDFFMQFILTLF